MEKGGENKARDGKIIRLAYGAADILSLAAHSPGIPGKNMKVDSGCTFTGALGKIMPIHFALFS